MNGEALSWEEELINGGRVSTRLEQSKIRPGTNPSKKKKGQEIDSKNQITGEER